MRVGDAVMKFANTADKGSGKLFVRMICPHVRVEATAAA